MLEYLQHFGKVCLVRTFSSAAVPNLKTTKINTSKFQRLSTPELENLAKIFQKRDFELRIAGGAVRDLLLDIQPKDVDFATTATPDEMKQMFEEENIRVLHNKGESHGTLAVRINDKENFEITTLRIDKVTDGRRAQVEFVKDWHLDANRRDLTVNSLFLGLDGTVYDYCHGIEDIRKRRIAFVGSARNRIQEDYLRILRYFRFYGRIATEADRHGEDTLEAIRENTNGLQRISGERLWMELKKICEGNFSKELILKMLDVGIGPYIGLPEKPDVQEFTVAANRSCPLEPQPLTLLSGLLRSEDELVNFRDRIKLSNYERDLALFIISHRKDEKNMRNFQRLACATSSQKAMHEYVCETFKYLGESAMLELFCSWQIPKFPVTGHAILEQKHKSRRRIEPIVNEMKRIWFDSDFTLTKEELISKIPEIVEKHKMEKIKTLSN